MPDRDAWLVKALRESAGELANHLIAALEAGDSPAGATAGAARLALLCTRLRDRERIVNWQLQQLADRRTGVLHLHDLEWLEPDPAPDPRGAHAALREFVVLRRETAERLWDLRPAQWRRRAHHPFRGEVSVTTIIEDLHRHDLECLWEAQRLADDRTAAASRAPRPARDRP